MEDELRDVSQYGEYTFLKNHFEKNPPKYKCLVDVGAKSMSLSNSYNFLCNCAWRGLLVEPNAINYDELMKIYERTPNVIVVRGAASNYTGIGKLYLHAVKGHHSLTRKSDRFCEVNVYKLAELLEMNVIPKDFDFLTVDAEGEDANIIECLLSESEYRPRVLLYEKAHGSKILEKLLKKFGYVQIHETRGNVIYEKRNK